jgi:hypothetical protein
MREVAAHALLKSPIGRGGELFLRIAADGFGTRAMGIGELEEDGWLAIAERIRTFWNTILGWDRKFLGIDALAEFFLVTNLAAGQELWPADSWRAFLLDRSRQRPDELTVHVGRFGDIRYLRLE